MMGRGLYAKLNDYMIREADWVAAKRTEYAIAVKRTTTRPDAATLDVMGARGERAGKIIFDPIEWHKELVDDPTNVPDLGDFIDIKTTPYEEPWLKVPAHRLHKEWAYVLTTSFDHPYYWFPGWLWGHELAEMELRFPARPAYCAEVAQLHPIYLLQQIAREL